MSEEKPKQDYPTIPSTMAFVWCCDSCGAVNSVTWDNYKFYNGNIRECNMCEKAYKVKTPWE